MEIVLVWQRSVASPGCNAPPHPHEHVFFMPQFSLLHAALPVCQACRGNRTYLRALRSAFMPPGPVKTVIRASHSLGSSCCQCTSQWEPTPMISNAVFALIVEIMMECHYATRRCYQNILEYGSTGHLCGRIARCCMQASRAYMPCPFL